MEQLNIKDLMIDDWVTIPLVKFEYDYGIDRNISTQYPVKIKENFSDAFMDTFTDIDDCVHYECFGIPLTKELLKLNWFEEIDDDEFELKCEAKHITELFVCYNTNSKELTLGFEKFDAPFDMNYVLKMTIFELHELQHIFKLFGIEKEWKVE